VGSPQGRGAQAIAPLAGEFLVGVMKYLFADAVARALEISEDEGANR
jgi:hypothetical protein